MSDTGYVLSPEDNSASAHPRPWYEKRIAELEAINSSMADDLCSMTGAYERAEQLEERVRELEAENERWVWVAHMVWTFPDDHPEDARSYPSRLAAKWRPGLSFHDGCFYGSLSALEETP